MKRSPEKKKERGPRLTLELPKAMVDYYRDRAQIETRGNVSELIRQHLAAATAARPGVEAQDFWPLIGLMIAMLDEIRLGRTYADDHIANARALLGLALERCFPIDGVEP